MSYREEYGSFRLNYAFLGSIQSNEFFMQTCTVQDALREIENTWRVHLAVLDKFEDSGCRQGKLQDARYVIKSVICDPNFERLVLGGGGGRPDYLQKLKVPEGARSRLYRSRFCK